MMMMMMMMMRMMMVLLMKRSMTQATVVCVGVGGSGAAAAGEDSGKGPQGGSGRGKGYQQGSQKKIRNEKGQTLQFQADAEVEGDTYTFKGPVKFMSKGGSMVICPSRTHDEKITRLALGEGRREWAKAVEEVIIMMGGEEKRFTRTGLLEQIEDNTDPPVLRGAQSMPVEP
jgi:hypothetical protein